MEKNNLDMKYRPDIDGLRAIAVVSVIFFHLGFLSEGYLGVDVFFVISGYLITKILFEQSKNSTLKLRTFYIKRIRRILPLLLLITTVALALGYVYMLPDDLENLSQSVIASNFSFNNMLLYITTGNYWAPANDFRPLLHTWSLGIEEQFYLIYPLIFLTFKGQKSKYILSVLVIITAISAILYLSASNVSMRFYFLHYRFFELSAGGIFAIYFSNRTINPKYRSIFLNTLLVLLLATLSVVFGSNAFKTIVVTLLTGILIVLADTQRVTFYHRIMGSRPMVFLGKISYSLYLWHFIIIAFARYSYVESFDFVSIATILILTFTLSTLSYYWVENTFRNPQKIGLKPALLSIFLVLIMSSTVALYTYAKGGIYKDFESLDIKKGKNQFNFFDKKNNIHSAYNEQARRFNHDFEQNNRHNVLVIGNSFGRDWVNVLLNSSIVNEINISYIDITEAGDYANRFDVADYVFISTHQMVDKHKIEQIEQMLNGNIDQKKLWVVGTKNFGKSNGIHYRKSKNQQFNYNLYSTKISEEIMQQNLQMQQIWEPQFIDILQYVSLHKNEVLVYTPDGKFISQDTSHFTAHGAKFLGQKLNAKLESIFRKQ